MTAGHGAPVAHGRRRAPGVVLDALAAEWLKLRSVRSTFWTLLVAGVTAVGGSAIVAHATARAGRSPFDPLGGIFVAWLEYPVLAIGILGVLVFTSEHATGQMRTTLTAVPQRVAVLLAKAGAIGALTLCFGEAVAFGSFLLGEAVRAGDHGLSLSHPHVPGAVAAAGFTLFAIALLGVGIGAIVRHTAGAVVALPGVVYLPLALLALPAPWGARIGRFSLLAAASQVVSLHPKADLLPPTLSMLVVAAWPAVAIGVATFLFCRRDA